MKVGNSKIEVIMGKTGIGKTTYLALLARKAMKKGIAVYSNVEIAGTYMIDIDDLGKYDIQNAVVIIDEAAIKGLNNREWKGLQKHVMNFFALHRHYRTHVIISTQSVDGIDVVVRRLAHCIYILQPCLFVPQRWFIKVKKVSSNIDINKDTGQIEQRYSYVPLLLLGTVYYYKCPAWSMFDSHEYPELQKKDFEYWSDYYYQPYIKEVYGRMKNDLLGLIGKIILKFKYKNVILVNKGK